MGKLKKLLAVATAVVLSFGVFAAEKTAKVVVEDGGATLRFVYDAVDYGVKGTDWYAVPESLGEWTRPDWCGRSATVTKVVFAESFKDYRPKTCQHWLVEFKLLTEIVDIKNLDTSEVTSFKSMFHSCVKLASVDVSGFDTSKAVNMQSMFMLCQGLTELDLSNFKTTSVTDMSAMFNYCLNLKTLDISGFDTKNVTNMQMMFYMCQSLASLDVSRFDTAKVENMGNMFYYCQSLKTLNLAGFDTAMVTDMACMFDMCTALKTIYASDKFVTAQASGKYGDMFKNCYSLVGENGTRANGGGNPTDGSYARIDKPGAPGYFSVVKTAKVVVEDAGKTLRFVYDAADYGTKGKYWFSVAEAEAIDPAHEDVPWFGMRTTVTKAVFDASFREYRPKQCGCWFYNFKSLTVIDGLCDLDTSEATSLAYMFTYCSALKTLDVSGFVTENVESMRCMFRDCLSLKTIYASWYFITDSVTDDEWMFDGCTSLVGGSGTAYNSSKTDSAYARLDRQLAPGYFTDLMLEAKVVVEDGGETLRFVYDDWYYLEWLPVDYDEYGTPVWAAYNSATRVVIDPTFLDFRPMTFSNWFCDFDQLERIEGVRNLNTSLATDFSYMFNGCVGLLELDVSGFDTANAVNMENMFGYCSNLTELDLASFDTRKVANMDSMFVDCSSLKTISVSRGFATDAVTASSKMFSACESLVGGNGTKYVDANPKDKTYARIDASGAPGYFSTRKVARMAKAVVENGGKTLRFVYDAKDYGTKDIDWFLAPEGREISETMPWYGLAEKVTLVVIDHSFKGYRPFSLMCWFAGFKALERVVALDNLDTSAAHYFSGMFYDCLSLTTLDLSGFDTANAYDMVAMFSGCSRLATILASENFVTASAEYTERMFEGCWMLMGEDGTRYDPDHADGASARVGTPGAPGYFTYKSAPVRATAKAVVQDGGATLRFVYDFASYGTRGVDWFSVAEAESAKGEDPPPWYGLASTVTKVVFDASFSDYRPVSCLAWFADFAVLSEVADIGNLDTSAVVIMNSMFYGCSSLVSLDISGFDSGSLVYLDYMFYGCRSLVTIRASDTFKLAEEVSADDMFYDCVSLEGGNGTTYNPENTGGRYARIDAPDVPGYFTDKNAPEKTAKAVVEDGGATLRFVYDAIDHGTKDIGWFLVAEAETFDLDAGTAPWYGLRGTVTTVVFAPSFSRYRTKRCSRWFRDFAQLSEIRGLQHFNTSAVTGMYGLFEGCASLESLDILLFDVEKVTDMRRMFYGCSSLETISAHPSFGAAGLSSGMFDGCTALVGGNGTRVGGGNPTDGTFARIDEPDAPGYFTNPYPGEKTAKVVVRDDGRTLRFVYDSADYDDLGVKWYSVPVGEEGYADPDWVHDKPLKVTKVIFDASFRNFRPQSCYCWFYGLENLSAVENIGNLDTSEATSLSYMFCDCSSLVSLDVSGFDTANAEYLYDMFDCCSSLVSLDVSGFDTAKAEDLSYMFYGCSSLVSLDISGFDTAKAEYLDSMFYGCSSLKTIYATGRFIVRSWISAESMFYGCTSLVGGRGTAYDPSKVGGTLARLDTVFQSGYFTDRAGTDLKYGKMGEYLSLDLEKDLGIVIDANYAAGDKATVKIEGLPKGLKVAQATGDWILSGVPAETVDNHQTVFVRVTVTYKDKAKGKVETLQPLPLLISLPDIRTLSSGVQGEAYGPADIATLWPEVAGAKVNPKDWSFKTWPSGLAYKDGALSGTPKKAGEFTVVATHKYKLSDGKTTVSETYSAVMAIWADDEEKSMRYTDQAYVATAKKTLTGVTGVSGQPTGIKFDKGTGTLSGTPTKPGVYVTTLTYSDKTKETFLWKVTEGENTGIVDGIDWLHSDLKIVEMRDAKVCLMQGLDYWWPVSMPAGAKVTVSGQPTGLKLMDYTKQGGGWVLEGVPTKTGNFVTTFKTVRNGVTVTERVAFEVLPNDFTGTFYAIQHPEYTASTIGATVTVAAGGTVKLILTENARKTTVSAKYIDQDCCAVMTLPADKKAGIEARDCVVDLDRCELRIDGDVIAYLCQPVEVSRLAEYDDLFTGVYNCADGTVIYITATVNMKSGVVGVSGKLSDGTAVKGTTCFVQYDGWVMAPVLVTDKQKRTWSITYRNYDNSLRVDGIKPAFDLNDGNYDSSLLKNKKLSDIIPGALILRIEDGPTFELTDKQLATKLGAGGLVKLTEKDDDGWTWNCELVPIGYSPDVMFDGIMNGKKGKDTRTGEARLSSAEWDEE